MTITLTPEQVKDMIAWLKRPVGMRLQLSFLTSEAGIVNVMIPYVPRPRKRRHG